MSSYFFVGMFNVYFQEEMDTTQETGNVKCVVAALTTPATGCPHCATSLTSRWKFPKRWRANFYPLNSFFLLFKFYFHMQCFAHLIFIWVFCSPTFASCACLESRKVIQKHEISRDLELELGTVVSPCMGTGNQTRSSARTSVLNCWAASSHLTDS